MQTRLAFAVALVSLTVWSAAVQQPPAGSVVIYERKNFGGRSATLPMGDNRMPDWKPASIRVPAGLVAFLSESVDEFGGYGITVDLLEDHRDLSEFGLSNNVSQVSVFASTRSFYYDLSDVPHVANISGTYPDHDLNIDVAPFVNYKYLIDDSHKPERSTELWMKDLVDSDHDPCTDPFIKVEAEVEARQDAMQFVATALSQRVGKPVAMYGPWIYDIGHCDHPEIHPAEQIWWTDAAPNNGLVYHLNVFADSSKRFWWRSQMDDGTKLHPWGAPPITGVFAIAFEVPTTGGQRFDVAPVTFLNVATVPDSNKTYDLVYGGRTLVSFVPHNDAFRVTYENVGLAPGTTNVVRGYLVIETTVGKVTQIATRVTYNVGRTPVTVNVPAGSDPDKVDQRIEPLAFKKEAGHYLFTVTRTNTAAGLVGR